MFALNRPAADGRSTGSTIGRLRRLAGATSPAHLPRRTVRLRLTALYGCLFLLSGAGLLAITNVLVVRQSTGAAFFISHASGQSESHIQGVVGSFSAPVGLPGPGAIQAEPQASAKIPANATPQQLRAQAHQLTVLAGKQRSTEQSHLLVISAIALGIMAVISTALGWLISGRVLRPLEETYEAQRRFVANASHELRTPLAMMRTSLDVAVAKPGPNSPQLAALEGKLREGLDQADRLLESFLALARAQRGAPPEQGLVSLARVLREATAAHARAAAEQDIQVRVAIADDSRVAGNEMLLRRMFDNVIDNAIRHNERGGWVRVATETADTGASGVRGSARGDADATKRIRVVIENGGPRLQADEVAELAQPFRRLGAERTGSQDGHGLGLSIVAAIAAAHGGALRLQVREEGGLRVRIDLPRSGPSPVVGSAAAVPAVAGQPSPEAESPDALQMGAERPASGAIR